MPTLGLTIDREVVIVEAPPNKNSVINNNTFFLFNPLCFFNINHYQFQVISKHFHDPVFQFYI